MVTFFIVCGLVGIGMILVVYGTVAKNRWGVNLSEVSCPRCKATLHQARKPRTLRQAMWGGYTCPSCGTEVDKWGRKINGPERMTA